MDPAELQGGPVPPIVVLEDEPAVARLIERVLGVAGVANPVEVVGDGNAAWARLEAHGDDGTPPVLVLLDVNVPGRSGLQVLEAMRAHPALATVPVVMLSGAGEREDVERATAQGPTRYLTKPQGLHELRTLPTQLGLRCVLLPATS
jgi:CheY-like chemotaxis protein